MNRLSWHSFRRWTAGGLLTLGLTLAFSLSTFTSAADSPEKKPAPACEVLKQWAKPYEGASVMLEELAKFDRAHRIAIFNAVTPEVRASLVQEELRRFKAYPDLSEKQRALIAEAQTLATPALYRHGLVEQKAVKEFWKRADKEFVLPEQRRPWFELGATVTPAVQNTAGSQDGSEGLAKSGLIKVQQYPWCECSKEYQDCGGGIACYSPYICRGWSGCGPIHTSVCNGTCNWP